MVDFFGFGIDLRPPFRSAREGYSSGQLRRAKVFVHPIENCPLLYCTNMVESQMCAQIEQTSRIPWLSPDGTCRGDSGGPLVYNSDTIIGLLSYGSIECNEIMEAAVYTNVSHYGDFIEFVKTGQVNFDEVQVIDYRISTNIFNYTNH